MPTYSEQSLSERALRKLGVLPNGQTADAADVALVKDKIEGCLADLRRREIYTATSWEGIQPEAFDHVATCLAAMCTNEFMVMGETLVNLKTDRITAESALRTIARFVSKPDDLRLQVPMGKRRYI